MSMARKLYAAPLSLLRQSSFKQQAKVGMNVFKDDKEVAGMEIENSDGGIGDIMLMFELRNKIIKFRDIIAFPHCDDSVPIAELIKRTLEDLNQLCPGILPDIKEMKEISLQQELSYLYEALKSFGGKWSKSQTSSANSGRSANGSPDVMISNQLGGHVIRKLDIMIKAGRQNFDIMHENRKTNVNGSREMSLLDIKNACPSPVSPRSIPPEMMRLGSFSDISKSLPPLLQAAEKCISLNIFRSLPGDTSHEKMNRLGILRRAKSSGEALAMLAKIEVPGSPKSLINHESDSNQMIKGRGTTEASLPSPLQSIAPPNLPSMSSTTEPPRERVPTSPSPITAPKSAELIQPSKTKRAAPPGPPPPPPPAAGNSRLLRLKRSDSKLKRSSHMGNLYRSLKRKLEGSNASGPTSNKIRTRVGGSSANGKQGWAAALAEITRRSAYFHQIEEDVQKHSQMIVQVKDAINSFKTKDMAELVKFHSEVEQNLEQLTDETQVLARFEDFPTKKLEFLRSAAALHLKLEAIAQELTNWKIDPPLDQLLDKVEKYFNKIKGEIEALDRTKDEDAKHFQDHDIHFDFNILVRIKELMVDVSSGSMELALKERRKADEARRLAHIRLLWRAFQLAFRVYTFAGGQDDRADRLTKELGRVLDAIPQN